MTRILIVAGALAASTLLGGWTFDRQGPYCLFDRNFTNCSFPSFQACIATASGVGGTCSENPMYNPDRQAQRRRRH